MSDPVPEFLQYGNQDYQFGLPEGVLTLIPGMAVTSLKPSWEPEFVTEAEGAPLVAAVAVGADKSTYEGSGYLLDEATFRAQKTMTFNDEFHIFIKKGGTYEHNGFQKCDFTTRYNKNVTS